MVARRSVLACVASLCGCFALVCASAQAAPSVEGESISHVTAESATLEATVNPGGASTTYYFQYGTSPSYGMDVPAAPGALAGTGSSRADVGQHVQGLQAATVYHYRVVAVSEVGGGVEEVDGPDQTFTTEHRESELALPDDRQWELVTPPDKHGALFYGLNVAFYPNDTDPFVAQAAAGGEAIVELASQPTEYEPQGNTTEISVLSTRGSSDWSSQVIAPPHAEGTGPSIGDGDEYRLFSEDLSRGALQPFGNFYPLSPEATESTPYLRTDYLNGDVNDHCQTSCYRPLVTRADTREGVVYGEAEPSDGECSHFICGPKIVYATPDLKYVVLATDGNSAFSQLTSAPIVPGQYAFYEWSEGQLQPLYLLPRDEGGNGVSAGPLGPSTYHQLSDDGSVFFVYNGHLYLHDFAKGESVRLDVAQGTVEPSVGAAQFLYASSEGTRVFFTDPEQLTPAPGGGVYECTVVETQGTDKCELALTGLPDYTLVGGSEDASYLYFTNAEQRLIVEHDEAGEWRQTQGPIVPEGEVSGLHGGTPFSTPYRISPNGLFLAFMSNQELTGYDNLDAVSGKPDEEVYLYSAAANELACASCNPTGSRPVGEQYDDEALVSGDFNYGASIWVAANLPPWTRSLGGEEGTSLYQPRYLSDSGRLFFDSSEALVPQDVDGTQDVYEYEPVGTGSCTASSLTYGQRSGGCVNLISSGSSPEESAFLDASETGGDVFFLTAAKLVPQDYDDALDVYDAHACTTTAPCFPPESVSPPPCTTGDACKAAPTPQPTLFGPAPSATFSGAGNVSAPAPASSVTKKSLTKRQKLARALAACRKRGKRALCERAAREKYGSKSGRAGVKRGKRG
jgi:hypothetical protein